MSHAFSLSVINILKICPKIMAIVKSLALSLLFHNFYLLVITCDILSSIVMDIMHYKQTLSQD